MAPISHPHIPQPFSEPVAYVSCTCGHSHVHAASQERPGVESVRSWLLPQISRAISQLGSHHSRPAFHRAISASYGSSQLQPLYLAVSWSPLQSPRVTPQRPRLSSCPPASNGAVQPSRAALPAAAYQHIRMSECSPPTAVATAVAIRCGHGLAIRDSLRQNWGRNSVFRAELGRNSGGSGAELDFFRHRCSQ